MSPRTHLLAVLVLGLLAARSATGQAVCPLTQITDTAACLSLTTSVDGAAVAFDSSCDLTGGNPDGNTEIFLFDGAAVTQVTVSSACGSSLPSLSGGNVAFMSICDLTGGNPGGGTQLFVFDGSTISQVTSAGDVFGPSADGGSVAFRSAADHTGNNADGNTEIFLFDGTTIVQITDTVGPCGSHEPSLDGGSVAFRSDCDLTSGNPDGNIEVFLFDGTTISQVTDTSGCGGNFFFDPRIVDLDGGVVAFQSDCDLAGGNADANFEIFLFDGTTFTQRTATGGCTNYTPRLDGGIVTFTSDCTADGFDHVFVSDGVATVDATPATGCGTSFHSLDGGALAVSSRCDLTGGNPDGNVEVFLGACGLASVVDVPAAGPVGLVALALLLVAAGWRALRRPA